MQGRLQLSCGHVDNDRMIIHDDNPNQGYVLAAGVVGGGVWVRGVRVQGRLQLNCGHVDNDRMIVHDGFGGCGCRGDCN